MEAYNILVYSDTQLVTHQILGMVGKKEKRMIAYASLAAELLWKFSKSEVGRIPREGNTEDDKLARMASAVEGTWARDLVLPDADAKSCFA